MEYRLIEKLRMVSYRKKKIRTEVGRNCTLHYVFIQKLLLPFDINIDKIVENDRCSLSLIKRKLLDYLKSSIIETANVAINSNNYNFTA